MSLLDKNKRNFKTSSTNNKQKKTFAFILRTFISKRFLYNSQKFKLKKKKRV